MKARLEAEVEIWDIGVFAELAVWESRPDLQLLCAAARDLGRGLDESIVVGGLPGLSPRACRNLLRHLEYIRLTDRNGALTPLGQRCAASGTAPSWEQGAYYLLVATHPLFGSHVLEFRRAAGDGQDREFGNLKAVPSWLAPQLDRVFTSVFDPSRQFSIAAFPSAGGRDPACRTQNLPPGKLKWEIDLGNGANRWIIEGQVGTEQPKAFRSQAESVESRELVGLYTSWEPRWDAKRGLLAMAYDGRAAGADRENFRRSRTYKDKKVARFGTFEEVVVSDIPVGPATDDDARTWATALLISRLETADAYVSPEAWRSEWSGVVEGTPLAAGAGIAPNASTLDRVNGKALPARTRWLLSTASDIGMGA